MAAHMQTHAPPPHQQQGLPNNPGPRPTVGTGQAVPVPNQPMAVQHNCAKCGQGIGGGRPGCTALNQTFHLDCFVCHACSNKLAGGSFYSIENNPHCEKCYENTLEKCMACNIPIKDRILRASGKPYHPACFKCVACNNVLDGVPFTVDAENRIHCVACYHE